MTMPRRLTGILLLFSFWLCVGVLCFEIVFVCLFFTNLDFMTIGGWWGWFVGFGSWLFVFFQHKPIAQ
jgi:hypothetical protein